MRIINGKIVLLFLFFMQTYNSFSTPFLSAEKPAETKAQHLIKLNLMEAAMLSTFNIKGEYEFITKNERFGFAIELGKTIYSVDEQVPAKGNFISPSITYYYANILKDARFGIKLKPFYHEIYIFDYLRFTNETNPNFTYEEYIKTHYTKVRYGATLVQTSRANINQNFFMEAGFGVTIAQYNTYLPEGVTQWHFKQGIYSGKDLVGFDPYLSLQFGYNF